MAMKKTKAIFNKYNPEADVVRCPYGRSAVRNRLNTYARAAVNLYGVISRDELVAIFNEQNTEQTSVEEAYILLLPLIRKEEYYCFYQNYLVHYFFMDKFDQVQGLLSHQGDKDRYIPEQADFLEYADEFYEDDVQWLNLFAFFIEVFGSGVNVMEGFYALKDYLLYDDGFKLGPILEKYDLVFNDEAEVNDFFLLAMDAKNNSRIWENKGHTPAEMMSLHRKIDKKRADDDKVIPFPLIKKEKIGRNDPCPCGSGKKYKKCCALASETNSARLNPAETKEFYEIWFGLMAFINKKEKIIGVNIKAEYPNRVSDVLIHKVREHLWENPDLIDEYIQTSKHPADVVEILQLWRTNHRKGNFFILEYKTDYALMIGTDDRLYGVKGISNAIASVMHKTLPITAEAVLLPFKGKIIYDGFLVTIDIDYGERMQNIFQELHDNAMKKGIITSLD
jgi:hypothetical protein